MFKWGAITFAAGVALVIFDISISRRKKEGFTPSDKQRVIGLFWVTCLISALVMAMIWMFPD